MRKMICIVCPKGCRIEVEPAPNGGFMVRGNACPRGEAYAQKEMTNPTRNVSSTAKIVGAAVERLPVKTDREIPKALVQEAVRELARVTVQAPIEAGDVVLEDVLHTGANFIATKGMKNIAEEKSFCNGKEC